MAPSAAISPATTLDVLQLLAPQAGPSSPPEAQPTNNFAQHLRRQGAQEAPHKAESARSEAPLQDKTAAPSAHDVEPAEKPPEHETGEAKSTGDAEPHETKRHEGADANAGAKATPTGDGTQQDQANVDAQDNAIAAATEASGAELAQAEAQGQAADRDVTASQAQQASSLHNQVQAQEMRAADGAGMAAQSETPEATTDAKGAAASQREGETAPAAQSQQGKVAVSAEVGSTVSERSAQDDRRTQTTNEPARGQKANQPAPQANLDVSQQVHGRADSEQQHDGRDLQQRSSHAQVTQAVETITAPTTGGEAQAAAHLADLGATPAHAAPTGQASHTGLGVSTPTETEAQAFQAAASRGLAAALRQSGGTVTLRLVPETLGALRVNMQISGDRVALHFETAGGRAHELLTQHMASLRAGFEQRGLKVDEVTTRIAPELGRHTSESSTTTHQSNHTSRERGTGDGQFAGRQQEQQHQQHQQHQQDDHQRSDGQALPFEQDGQAMGDSGTAGDADSAFLKLHNVMLRLNAVA